MNWNKNVLPCAVLLAVPTASFSAFTLNSVDLGGDAASFGSPITTSTTYYQDAFGNNYPPSAAFINVFPTLECDSYIAMDSNGRSTGTYTSSAPGGSTPGFSSTAGHFPDTSTLTGGYFTGGGVPSALGSGGFEGVFIGQVTTDGVVDAPNVRVNTSGDVNGTTSLSANSDVNGGEGPAVNGLVLWIICRPDPSIGPGWYDCEIWVCQVPTPGAAGLLGLAGIAAVRRRR